MPTFAFAASPQENQTDACVAHIEQELYENQTSVVDELDKMIDEYTKLYDNTNNTSIREKSKEIIATISTLREEYLANKLSANTYSLHPIYAIEVASVIAYFNLMGYNLAAELLTHMKSNTILDSEYIPLYGGDVCESSVFQAICDSQETSGSSEFPKSGNKNDMDLYYAIHAFDFTKYNNYTYRISDRYDFLDEEYTSIAGIAIKKMYQAQQDGYLTPFRVIIYAS